MHRGIKKHLRVLAASFCLSFVESPDFPQVDNWSVFLDIIKFKLNTTPAQSTGICPIEMVLGFKPTVLRKG